MLGPLSLNLSPLLKLKPKSCLYHLPDSSNVAHTLAIFLTVFAVFSFEPFADTLVIVFFVRWQTLAVVLTGPVSAGRLQKNMYYDARFKEHESCRL